jgi:hypothetical protein
MSQSKFLQYLKQLYKEQRELTILEITYLIIAVLSFLVAAVIALLNQSLGVALLIIPFVSFLALSANIIVWALIRMLLEESTRADLKRSQTEKIIEKSSEEQKPKRAKVSSK